MMRLVAYPYVLLVGLGAIMAVYIGVVEGIMKSDAESTFSCFAFAVFWSWTAVTMYTRHIKRPREEKRRHCAEAVQILEKSITPGAKLSIAVHEVRIRFPIVGEPRYYSNAGSSIDTVVELETRSFIISLLGRSGEIVGWNVK